jgi:hypothetical protein
MARPAQQTPRELAIEKGDKIVVAIIACFILVEGLAFVLKILNGQGASITGVIRLAITLVSCACL